MKLALAAIELEVGEAVLESADVYRRHLEGAAARALDGAGAADARLVVFPELTGHLALYAQAPPATRRAKTLAGALAGAAMRRPLDVLRGVVQARRLDAHHAVLSALAPDAERWWKGVFAPLARRHAAYVVAGSHLHLSPAGALTNASLVFAPDGRQLALTHKCNLVAGLEDGAKGGLALARGDVDAIPIVDTAFGKLCTWIGYDAFRAAQTADERFVEVAPRIAARGGVTVVANPSATTRPWRWREDGLPATLAAAVPPGTVARYAASAQLTGGVLDLAFAGASEILERTGDAVRTVGHVTATVSW